MNTSLIFFYELFLPPLFFVFQTPIILTSLIPCFSNSNCPYHPYSLFFKLQLFLPPLFIVFQTPIVLTSLICCFSNSDFSYHGPLFIVFLIVLTTLILRFLNSNCSYLPYPLFFKFQLSLPPLFLVFQTPIVLTSLVPCFSNSNCPYHPHSTPIILTPLILCFSNSNCSYLPYSLFFKLQLFLPPLFFAFQTPIPLWQSDFLISV